MFLGLHLSRNQPGNVTLSLTDCLGWSFLIVSCFVTTESLLCQQQQPQGFIANMTGSSDRHNGPHT